MLFRRTASSLLSYSQTSCRTVTSPDFRARLRWRMTSRWPPAARTTPTIRIQLFFYFLICLFFYLSVYLFITWSIILFINLLILYLTIYWHSICPSSIYFETVSVLFKLKPIRFNIKLKKYIFKIAQKVAKYASFSFIFGLYKNQNNLRDNNLKTNPSSIQRWNFNSQSINLPHNH